MRRVSCCDELEEHLNWSCDMHDDPYDCPDAVILRSSRGQYGLPIHYGGRSYIVIGFCPWCGADLRRT
jgi:hypothetical protein